MGLGLSLAKEFTDLIRGSIRIDSEVGVGTVVNLSIPLNAR
ncbi:histidine kinase-, DNA gyrase B-, and HSP90-like ATPase family protein [Collimonas arenae]|nr:histidine kinase-, DNA gyrase B-, and HSP90-like ATPase family protein [Collimonas arenae]